MNAFIEKLVALRNGAGNIMSGIEERSEKERQFKRDRNENMINNTFGSVENYRKFLSEQPPAPDTIGQKLSSFIERLMQLRGGAEN